MRWDDVYVAGLGSYLPQTEMTSEQAVAEGLYDPTENLANGILAVRIAGPGEAPVEMAAAAAAKAVARSGHRDGEFGLVLHAGLGHQGQDYWTPASYVQDHTVGGEAAAIEIRQGSNGGLAGVELAASWVAARRGGQAALVTAADSFHLPYFDRWKTDVQLVYGDGAGAVVLSSRTGFARLRATVSIGDGSFEPLYRGSDAWTPHPFASGKPIDLRARKRDHLMKTEDGYEGAVARMGRHMKEVIERVVAEAGTTVAEVDWFVHANLGQTIAQWAFYDQFGIDRARTVYDWGRSLGHMGAGDQLIGFTHLAESGRLRPGDLVLTAGAGIGFMWSAAVLEILEPPVW
ncbi:ketoacyl-ACP synthase III family protein [Kitasatospora sp. NPDC002227]|uniref:ketoacyl-ACP synthase III family protein n=1 Tax=Kitasatospora sp. NPDC002227 TaxID=3154773 RepID=UPI00332188C0